MQYLDIIEELRKKEFFTLEDLKKYYENNKALQTFLIVNKKKGIIKQIRRGFYTIKDIKTIDGILLTKALYPNAILAFQTALKIHGVQYFETFRAFTCITKTQVRALDHTDIEIKPLQMKIPNFGIEEKEYRNEKIKTTDFELTIIHCIQYPQYALGYENIYKAIFFKKDIDMKKICKYLDKLKDGALAARVIFFLNQINKLDQKILNKYKPKNKIEFEPGIQNDLFDEVMNIKYSRQLMEELK